jgi:release factor glutamine methyltransferase
VKESGTFETGLDVGTGSGAIALTLLLEGICTTVTATDISPAALEVARANARRLRAGECRFIQSDRLQAVSGKFQLIVSNPPYIKPVAHGALVQTTVRQHEPGLALFIDDASYDDWFKGFFREVREHLHPGGSFFMEGHEQELEQQARLLRDSGWAEAEVLKDWAGLDRYLRAKP